ncbi:alpha-1,2-mannosidase, putative [Sinomicrobium oceani]|uniref:Alpha-1,2-mannosidase, putative n=1 Tax=Sinomicrobium oceani TaxID=1150368 RepID=A0A1K1MNL6_9FLAO|nr:GH92 family glycosyl hydrolase [Sinomicrobium oceani]SFW24673.1 alpha-1,2-mannosidase, putative [Sinomicrobium oceani]
MRIIPGITFAVCSILMLGGCNMPDRPETEILPSDTPVDHVNPYMGNISHLLVPTFPTIHLPNSMLRVYPERNDYTGDLLHGLPLVVTSHRGSSAFNLSPVNRLDSGKIRTVTDYSYDREKINPYSYSVYLDDEAIEVHYGLSHQAGMYELDFEKEGTERHLVLASRNGLMEWDGTAFSGYQQLANTTRVYIYAVPGEQPSGVQIITSGTAEEGNKAEGEHAALAATFPAKQEKLVLRYGISFIDAAQAQANMEREVAGKALGELWQSGKEAWNKALGKIEVQGDSDEDKTVFYTSLYRTYERPVCISEDGRYFSAFDGKVHEDGGRPFYTDDWIWDSYRAHHPLRILVDPKTEEDILHSFLLMAEQMDDFWMPTFPEITGDSRRMNSNHAVASFIDAYRKGLRRFNLEEAYRAAKGAITEKTLAPWSGKPAGWLDAFYKEHGYIPALYPDEKETVPEVNTFEKRQPVAVSLGTAYDQWCLAEIAKELDLKEDYRHFLGQSYNYRKLFNPETSFFHPKDKNGKFIEPFDYVFSGGLGARNYYGENNAWTYRWDVQHNIADLIALMGGREQFVQNLDSMFAQPLGTGKFRFYAQLPDQTGNVGQFTMANEPSLHIPYLYNYAGQPWKTQKRIRKLVKTWFRNDLMGVPGDEDGGGMSSFVVFSQLGFYPVTPGMPVYAIGSPFFKSAVIHLDNGKKFEVITENYAEENNYIQSAELHGKPLDKPWFSHEDIRNGGILKLVMGNRPRKTWGSDEAATPPSGEKLP